jgi:hypothetical protein
VKFCVVRGVKFDVEFGVKWEVPGGRWCVSCDENAGCRVAGSSGVL